MTQELQSCLVCQGRDGGSCVGGYAGSDRYHFECENCGDFDLVGTAKTILEGWELSPSNIRRAALAYKIQQAFRLGSQTPLLNSDDVRRAMREPFLLPTPKEQAQNIIRLIGSHVQETGEDLEYFPSIFAAYIGAPSRNAGMKIAAELHKRGMISGIDASHHDAPYDVADLNLTLDGWESYEAGMKGRISGSFGFLAMKFNDLVLEPFSRDVIKPAVKAIGYELVDIRDTAEAGIIDNLLRARIRDAAFVLVDLTHDNSGAYWEAGYAEGLGKPVLYLCERRKFDEKTTHFDTNHCTTVVWDVEKPEAFSDELVATLRRSLNLF